MYTLSFKIAEILEKPLNQLFYFEPLIKIKIESLSLKELKDIAKSLKINYEKLVSLSEVDENQLSKEFNNELLIKILNALDLNYNDIFED